MKCPQCENDLKLPDIAIANLNRYGNRVMTATLCCGQGVNLYPKFSYSVTSYEGDKEHDDWGVVLKQFLTFQRTKDTFTYESKTTRLSF